MNAVDPIFNPGGPRPGQPDNSYRWGTITDTDPLRVRLDGDSDGLLITPDTLVHPRTLAIGDRVWLQFYGRRVVVLGKGGGTTHDPDWIAPNLLNGWLNYGSSWPGAGYRKGRDGMVKLRGLVKSGTGGISTPIFVLPQGYAPEGTSSTGELFIQPASVSGGFGYARVDVLGDGSVAIIAYGPSASNAFVSLAGISFYPAGG